MFRNCLPTSKVCLFLLLSATLFTLSGCGKVKVPDLSGMTRAQAESALTGAKLAVGTVSEEYHATVAADRVIRQTPEAGLKVKTRSAVAFVVSKGPEPPAQIAVPYVVGMARAAAEAALTGAGLALGTVTEVYDATVPAGQVLSQNPAAGTMAAPGSAVNLTVSKGPEPPVQIAVPDVVGMTQAAAEAALTGAGLTVGTVTEVFSDSVPAGQVVSQNPAAATLAIPGFAVNLTVSKGPAPVQIAVPDVVGMTQAEAEAALTGAGLIIGTVTEVFSDTVPAGQVISQDPAAAVLVAPGAAVALEVSKGVEPVAVPDVVGMTQAAAEAALTGAGFTVGAVTEVFSATVPAGQVISQDPVAAVLATPGSAVALVVSKGVAPVAVPNVVGMTQAAATTALTGAGFTAGTVIESFSATVPAGQVISQTPAAGVLTAPGSAVDLEVSKGPVPAGDKEVPDVVGMTQAAAATALTTAELTLGAVVEAYSATVPAGQVISQNPAAGLLVAAGTPVNLTVSQGPAPVAVPNVVGMTQAAASTALAGAGFGVGAITEAYSATVPAGQVISQNPAAGALAAPGTAVDLVVSQGPAPVAVPNVVGMTQAAATTALTGAGFTVGAVTEVYSATVPAGQVISQTPGAGVLAVPGSAVALEVSKGPAPGGDIAVPDVTGLTQAAAEAALTAAELAPGTVTEAYSETVPAGQVISQSPAAGTLVAENTPVNLVVSLGSEPVNVPDAGLAAAIRDQLSLAPATPLTRAHLAALTTLSAYNRGVADLTGIGHAVNLVNFDLGNNTLADLTPLSGLATLDSLNLSTNLITNLGPLSGLSGLLYLTLSDNQISDLAPLSGMSGLVQLNLNENQIADLTPLAGLTGLEALNVSNNLITDLTPLSGLTALESLGAGSNQVASLAPLAGLTALTELSVGNNQITTLAGIGTLVNLETLYANSNALANADALSGLASLTTLYLGDNQLTGLPDISALTGLVYLDIRYNQLTDTDTLSTLTALNTLDLRGNQISDVTGLSGLSVLWTLNLSYNQITDAAPLAGLTALQWLSLRSNRLTDAAPLAGLSNLYSLNLRTNNLVTVAPLVGGAVFTTPSSTPELNVQGNPLLAEVCDTQIPSLEARGVTVYHDACTGPVHVPDLAGMTRAAAQAALEALGLYVDEVTEVFSETVPAGYLTDQDPPAGLPVVAGSGVDITVSAGPEGGQLVLVPDANLAAAIRAILGLDAGTPLTTAHLANLNSLGANSSGIADLTGLEYAVNAVYLNFYNNNVSSAAPLAGLTSLQGLTLSMNPVTDLAPLAGLTNLTTLYLYLCGAADITPLAGLVHLHELDLTTNGLTDLGALSGMTELTHLYVNDNALTSLAPLSGLPALVHLEAHHNQLADVSGISGLVGLGHLNLANNQIQDASPLAGLLNLDELNLRYNFLTTVAAFPGGAVFTAAESTPHLYLEQNPLLPEVCDTQIPALEARGVTVYKDPCTGPVLVPDVTGTAQSAADAALTDAGLLTGDVAGVSSDTVPAGFVISQNPAANTPVTPGYEVDLTVSTGPEAPVLVNVPDPNLAAAIRQQLGLDPATALTTAHLASLFWLQASYENIADMTGLEYAVNLTDLNLGANPISDVTPLAGLPSLQSLDLYECALSDIGPLAGLSGMQSLNLRNNAITDITPLAGMTRIIALYLNDNALADIGPLSGLTGLIALYLGNNQVQDVSPLASLAALNELSLGGNHVTSVAALASGTVFSAATSPTPYVELYANPLLAAACDTEIPALEARGVTVYRDACAGAVYVPDVTGDSQASATHDLTAAGLGVGTVTQVFSDTVPAGFVAGQHPAAGIPVIPGYSVDLTVSQGPEAAQLVNVPDVALAEAIRSRLGLASGTPLTTAHLAALTDLSAAWIGVADLTGLEYAVNLVQLYLGGGAFTDLSPLAGLSGLYYLGLDSNAITDITPLAGLPHLDTLYLGTCDVADVSPLAGLTTLTYLDLNYNEVADVSPLSGLVNLYLLGLSHNRLTDVSPLAGMAKLQSLSVSGNFLTTLAPLAAGTAFTEGSPAELYAYENPLLPEVCDTQIPQIEARGVTVYRNDCEGPVYMPDVTGETRVAAAAKIQEATINLSAVEEAFSATVPAGFVISQFPAAGTPVTPWYPATLTVSTGPEGGQAVNVPDANLAAIIRTELGLDPGTPLTTAHLASLNSLSAAYSSVADLTGLEYAVNMQSLYVDGNDLSTLAPLAGLPSLQVLYASSNLLTDISPAASLSGLTVLYLYDNGITDAAPVSGLTGLTYLNLQNNFLTDVSPMAGLAALENLGVSGNYLTTLAPLVSGTTFTLAANTPELHAANNPFSTDVCDTQIPALEVRGVTVSHDPCPGSVTTPDVVGMTALSASNAIAAAGLIVGMQSEHSATVPAGHIIRQSPPAGFPVPPGAMVNAISSLGPEGGVLVNVPDAALANAIRDALSLAPGTPLTTAHLASVSYLYIDGLGVTDLTGLEWAVNLFHLYMNTNAPADLGPLAGLTGMDTLACYDCGLSDLSPLAGLVMLRTLSLGDNQISDLTPLAGLTRLESLDLNYNEVADLSPLAGLTRLESLDLNYNEVADLSPLAGLTALTSLHLSDNQVSDLTALIPLTQLVYLGLSNNLITDASPLANLSALEMLALQSNHLTTLAPLVAGTIFTEAVTPGDVYFGYNPFETDVCDTQIPALEARNVTIYHDVCPGSAMNPDVVGLTRVGAETALGLVGLYVGVVTEVSSETVPAGYVVSQDPPAGLPVVPTSSVSLAVSTGPETPVAVTVPDGGLADAIRSLLSLPPATPLTTAHLAALTTITINSAGVTDLTGLEYAVNLTNLYAADNALTSVAPLGGLVNLVNVYLGTNLLTDASPFAGMPVIAYLDLGNNQLTDTAPLAGLATLQELGLNFNQLTTLAPLVSGTVFTAAAGPPRLYVSVNPFIADVCATQIPALEAAGITVYDSCP